MMLTIITLTITPFVVITLAMMTYNHYPHSLILILLNTTILFSLAVITLTIITINSLIQLFCFHWLKKNIYYNLDADQVNNMMFLI